MPPKKTIQELTALYKRESSVIDIFTEGPTDKAIIKWFLDESNVKNVNIYDISTVEIPREIIEKHEIQLENDCDNEDDKIEIEIRNNRKKLITLSLELELEYKLSNDCIRCIADSDTDIVCNSTRKSRYLLYTDYSCMEMYFFDIAVMKKLFDLFLLEFKFKPVFVLDQLRNVLQELFVIRIVNEHHQWRMTKLRAKKMHECLQCNCDGKIHFDVDQFINKYLCKNKKHSKKSCFCNDIEKKRNLLTDECRNQMNGHDFIGLLNWYMKENKDGYKKDKTSDKSLYKAMFLSLNDSFLIKEQLFKNILTFAANNNSRIK